MNNSFDLRIQLGTFIPQPSTRNSFLFFLNENENGDVVKLQLNDAVSYSRSESSIEFSVWAVMPSLPLLASRVKPKQSRTTVNEKQNENGAREQT